MYLFSNKYYEKNTKQYFFQRIFEKKLTNESITDMIVKAIDYSNIVNSRQIYLLL